MMRSLSNQNRTERSGSGRRKGVSRRQFVSTITASGVILGFHMGAPGVRTNTRPNHDEAGVSTQVVDEDGPRPSEPSAPGPIIGGNLNGRPHRIANHLELIDASRTTWIRAFLDIRRMMENGADPNRHPDIVALRRAANRKNCKLVVSLKWDFKANWGDKEPMRIPAVGSPEERRFFRYATRCLTAIDAPLEVVILGNEPMWETLDADIKVANPRIVQFTRDAKEHLVQHGDFGDPTYLAGSFNRSNSQYTREVQFRQFHRQMFDFVRDDPDVAGIDIHAHFSTLTEARNMVRVARETLPEGVIAVTEFSPVFRYQQHIHIPIGEQPSGAAFATKYDLSDTMTPVEYFEYAKANPRPPSEIFDFYEAMPWYNVNHVSDMYDIFSEFDVSIGTFGFLQGIEMRREDWTKSWSPFHINFLFQPAIMQTDDGWEHTAHPHYIEDYRRLATPDEPTLSKPERAR